MRSLESDRKIVADFLDDGPQAIATVSRWAREVADHRAWGFDTPDDIVQSALLALVGNFRGGRWVDGDLRAYVRRIAKNLCVTSYRRKLTRGVELSIDAGAWAGGDRGGAPELVAPSADPERTARVRQIVDGLDEGCRGLIDLAFVQGLRRREIARELGISEGAARARLFRCLERARTRNREAGGES